MTEILALWWVLPVGLGATILFSVVCGAVYFWQAQRTYNAERQSPIPMHVWRAFADSLEEPERTQMHRYLDEPYYPLGAIIRLCSWLDGQKLRTHAETVPAVAGVYIVQCQGQYKIGCSRNVRARVGALQTGNPLPMHVVCVIPTPLHEELEGYLHRMFANKRLAREWFRLTADDLTYLARLARKPAEVKKIVSSLSPQQ